MVFLASDGASLLAQPDLGKKCPPFRLHSVDGGIFCLDDFSGAKVFVVFFICNHCPYVKAVEDRLIQLGKEYGPKEVAFAAICSNDPTEYPEDAPAELLKRWHEKSYPFPYLVDDTQKAAKNFGAVCTPDIYVYDQKRKLSYRGRLDDSWKNPDRVQKRELKMAIDTLLRDEAPSAEQIPTMGCSIKWKDA